MKEFHNCNENPKYNSLFAMHQHHLPVISYISYSLRTYVSSTQQLAFLSEISSLLLLVYIFFYKFFKIQNSQLSNRVDRHDLPSVFNKFTLQLFHLVCLILMQISYYSTLIA